MRVVIGALMLWLSAVAVGEEPATPPAEPTPGDMAPKPIPSPPPKADDLAFKAFWKDGLWLETAGGVFLLNIGGRLLLDAAWISEDRDVEASVGAQEDGVESRSVRLHVQGEFSRRLLFRCEFDFAGGDVALKDGFLGIRGLPLVGTLRVGHMKEFYGLEQSASPRFTTFMERGLPDALTAGSENMGASFLNTHLEDRLFWSLGVFKETDKKGYAQSEGEWALTGRVCGLPWWEDDGRRLLHLGLGASLRSPVDGEVQVRQRPEMHLASYYVDTGVFEAERQLWVAGEAALVWGPLSLQGECMLSQVISDPADDPVFKGFYAIASWFATGEHRPYKKAYGVFDRVRPLESAFGTEAGWGAVELAARYSRIDLDSRGIRGGNLADVTAGVTWYPNPYVRIMLNYVFADLWDVGDTHGLMTRFQVDF